MIGGYNKYHLRPKGIAIGNQRWYGLVYLVYKRLVNLRQGEGYNRRTSGALSGRVTFREEVQIKLRKL